MKYETSPPLQTARPPDMTPAGSGTPKVGSSKGREWHTCLSTIPPPQTIALTIFLINYSQYYYKYIIINIFPIYLNFNPREVSLPKKFGILLFLVVKFALYPEPLPGQGGLICPQSKEKKTHSFLAPSHPKLSRAQRASSPSSRRPGSESFLTQKDGPPPPDPRDSVSTCEPPSRPATPPPE